MRLRRADGVKRPDAAAVTSSATIDWRQPTGRRLSTASVGPDLNQRPLGCEGIPVLKVNRSKPKKAKLDQHFSKPPSDPSRFSLVAVHAQNPAQLLPRATQPARVLDVSTDRVLPPLV